MHHASRNANEAEQRKFKRKEYDKKKKYDDNNNNIVFVLATCACVDEFIYRFCGNGSEFLPWPPHFIASVSTLKMQPL